MKAAELRNKNDEDLAKLLAEHRSELLDLRFQHSNLALENPAKLGQVKRQIARIHHVINEREIAAKAGS